MGEKVFRITATDIAKRMPPAAYVGWTNDVIVEIIKGLGYDTSLGGNVTVHDDHKAEVPTMVITWVYPDPD